MKNLIKKILKESDWDWAKEIPAAVDDGYFTPDEERGTSLNMAKKVMKEYKVDLERAVNIMWENFPWDAENVFVWHIVNPRSFEFEGVEYLTDVDEYTGSIGIYPTNVLNYDKYQFYATPNYNDYGITPINYVVHDRYLNQDDELEHPKFEDVNEMKNYYRNIHHQEVMGLITYRLNGDDYNYYKDLGIMG